MENIAQVGMSRCYKVRPSAVFALKPPQSVVFFVHTSIGSALSVILYFLVLLGVFISHALTASIFGDQTISKCSCNLFLVVEPTGRTSFSDLQCHSCDQSCCLSGVVFITFLT